MDSRTLCLGVLMLGAASGYEIKKHFAEGPFAHFHAAGFGSIYPALGALLDAGHVTCTPTAQDGRPDKKVYAITEAGRQAFRQALNKPPAADAFRSETVFMLFFADHLEADHRRAVFQAYLAEHRDHIARMTQSTACACATVGQRFVHGLGLAIYQATVDYLDQNGDMLFSPPDVVVGDGAAPRSPLPEAAVTAAPLADR